MLFRSVTQTGEYAPLAAEGTTRSETGTKETTERRGAADEKVSSPPCVEDIQKSLVAIYGSDTDSSEENAKV